MVEPRDIPALLSARKEILEKLKKPPLVFGPGGLHEFDEPNYQLSQHMLEQFAKLPDQLKEINLQLGLAPDFRGDVNPTEVGGRT